jgi:SNF2 family DNA or RNA helicase/transcriptional regulator with XRE-family HTH domain
VEADEWPRRVRSLRDRLSLTQADLADFMGVSFATVNRWERGRAKPSRLAAALLERAEQEGIDALRSRIDMPQVAAPTPAEAPATVDFGGDPEIVQLVAEGERLTYGHLFNPAFATEISRIDPLPHQRLAVYRHMVDQPRLRFLLADDAGAGKTIMSGLYIREMLNRRLVRRVLILSPAGLIANWQRELSQLFGMQARILTGRDLRAANNPFAGRHGDLIVVSIDTLARERAFSRLQAADTEPYDLVVIDEAHKLSASIDPDGTERKTDRYLLAEALAGIPAREDRWSLPWAPAHFLLLSATPHMGRDLPYFYLWRLLEPEVLTTPDALAAYPAEARALHFLRRTKEEMIDYDEMPLFPPRTSDTFSYELTQGPLSEQTLYDETTRYIGSYYNRARFMNRSAARLAMSVFQRRLASSTYALLRSLERRAERLTNLLDDLSSGRLDEQELQLRQRKLDRLGDLLDETTADEESADAGEEEHETREAQLLEAVTAVSRTEMQVELGEVQRLIELARAVHEKGDELKFAKLREVLLHPAHSSEKFLIFTEHRDTMSFLVRRLEGLGYAERVAQIHGGMDYREREEQIEFFRRSDSLGARFMVATDAAGEGINLQFCWLMVNYDVPWNPARLEQRMGRVHRYGQRHAVLIVNLVAGRTREGRVVQALLTKLERIRNELASDKVFDVVGRLFAGVPLSEYMARVAMGDNVDDVTRQLTGRLTADQVRALEAREKRVYGDGGDVRAHLGALREESEREEFRRLLPGYVLRFVQRAASRVDIGIEGDTDRVFSLVPIRSGALDPLLTAMEEYPLATREGFTVHRPSHNDPVIFLHPGEPVFDRLRAYVADRFEVEARRGTVLIDPTCDRPYLFHLVAFDVVRCANHQYRGLASDRVLTSCLIGLKQTDDAIEVTAIEHLLALHGNGRSNHAGPSADDAIAVARRFVESVVGADEATRQRMLLAGANAARGTLARRGYDLLEGDLAAQRVRLASRSRSGDVSAKAQMERVRARQRQIGNEREAVLASFRVEPEFVGVDGFRFVTHAWVVPTDDPEEQSRYDAAIEAAAVQVAVEYERSRRATVVDVSTPAKAQAAGLNAWPGFDVHSRLLDRSERAIEVKGRARVGDIHLTENEWAKAATLRDRYWLYVVFDCATAHPRLLRVCDPFGRLVARPVGGVLLDPGEIDSAAEAYDL